MATAMQDRKTDIGPPHYEQFLPPVIKKNYGQWKYHRILRPGVMVHVAESGDELFTVRAGSPGLAVGKFQIREYVYWEGGSNRFHPEASTPFCFTFHVPRRWVGLGYAHRESKDFPPWLCSLAKVAGYSISYWDGRGIVMDTGYMPPTRLAPFPPGAAQNMQWRQWSRFYYGSRTPPPQQIPIALIINC